MPSRGKYNIRPSGENLSRRQRPRLRPCSSSHRHQANENCPSLSRKIEVANLLSMHGDVMLRPGFKNKFASEFQGVPLAKSLQSQCLLGSTSVWWRRQWHPTPVLLPGKPHGRRTLVGCSPWGREESDTTERLPFHFSLSCIGEGNGNPLQCSCLENPRDGGAWWASIYGVAQSQTRLKWLSSSSSSSVWTEATFFSGSLQTMTKVVYWISGFLYCIEIPTLHTETASGFPHSLRLFLPNPSSIYISFSQVSDLDHGLKDLLAYSFSLSSLSGTSGKESTYHVGNTGEQEMPFDPWVRKISWREKWWPTPVFSWGKSHGQKNLAVSKSQT